MENIESLVVPYVTTAARLAFDALVAAYRKVQPEKSVNFFLWDILQLALKDPAISHDGVKDLQIKQLGRAYMLDNAKERLFGGDDIGLDNLAQLLTDEAPLRPKKSARCCQSDWFQAIARGGVQVVRKTEVDTRLFVKTWGEIFLSMADQHSEGRGPLVSRFRKVFQVICGTPDLIDLMGMLKRQKAAQEALDLVEEETSFQDFIAASEPEIAPLLAPRADIRNVKILENPYEFDWKPFGERISDWPRVFVRNGQVFFIARTYLDDHHRRVYEGGQVVVHKNGHREKLNVHDLPLIMQVIETDGRVEMKYTVTSVEAKDAIGMCGKIWKNVRGIGDEVSLYRWFVIVKDPNNETRTPVVHLTSQSQFNRFSEARLEASIRTPQPTV